MNDLVVIIIIGYKPSLTENEKSSLRQCYKIFHKYSIKIISPEGMDVSEYKKVNPAIEFDYVDPTWTSNYDMSSLFKIDELLYQRFINYKFLMYYELDAWVFSDQMEYWCNKEWDFIGAPWFEHLETGYSSKIVGVGNGGFCLRRNRSCVRLAKRVKFLKKLRKTWIRSYLQGIVSFEKVVNAFRKPLHIRNMEALTPMLLDQNIIEDFYWTKKIAVVFDDFKVATIEDASRFSFEVNPSLLYKMNDQQLPFGCHGWEKYEPAFWKEFIHES
ncbi:MAG: DUF5672 family protein [Ferruginibacter sp.]